MPELSVTDVQRMLRDHADFGHDVISDPRVVYLSDAHDIQGTKKPYPLPVKHSLLLNPDTQRSSALVSHLSHGEKPTLTYVRSLASHIGNSITNSRTVALEHPWHMLSSNENNELQEEHTFLHRHSPELVNPSTSIHSVIAEQYNTPPIYLSDDLRVPPRGLTVSHSYNHTNWDPVQALHTLAKPLEPFSGMVLINTTDSYLPKAVYNPATEQLHPIVRKDNE